MAVNLATGVTVRWWSVAPTFPWDLPARRGSRSPPVLSPKERRGEGASRGQTLVFSASVGQRVWVPLGPG